ncbi:MAG: ABC transporter ATP-binding protein [Armatimonadetes bacterium]|nr:ABC transporter ATP-binding protein [Armatimonadota bacterium]
MGSGQVEALKPLDLRLNAGEFVTIVGPSGSGKTTLLNLIGGIDSPTEGKIVVQGQDISRLNRAGLTEYRRTSVGIVFQFFNLIPNLTARENVELIADLTGARRSALEVLDMVGLSDRLDHFPHELSGGEQQRVAIARALVKDPPILLGDEPTGNLDCETGRRILKLLQQLRTRDRCIILVTHNTTLTRVGTRVIQIGGGRVQSDTPVEDPAPADELTW